MLRVADDSQVCQVVGHFLVGLGGVLDFDGQLDVLMLFYEFFADGLHGGMDALDACYIEAFDGVGVFELQRRLPQADPLLGQQHEFLTFGS